MTEHTDKLLIKKDQYQVCMVYVPFLEFTNKSTSDIISNLRSIVFTKNVLLRSKWLQ